MRSLGSLLAFLLLTGCGPELPGDPIDPADRAATNKADAPEAGARREILAALGEVAGLTVKEVASSFSGYRAFALELDQPVDHASPAGARFRQRLFLLHRDAGAPMVVYSSGYHLDDRNLHEPATLLGANQLSVEHRFFGPSTPKPADWRKDTIAQSAADYHRIIEALRPIYRQRWITTGISKGGMTSIYHRRFYPEDVDGTVAYVAPQSFAIADARYVDFVEKVGDASCRSKLAAVQRLALDRRAAMLSELESLEKAGHSFSILGREKALEHVVIDLPFTFWQYTGASGCAGIPDETSDDSEIFWFLRSAGFLDWYEDKEIKDYQGYHYQSLTQLGTPAQKESHLLDRLQHPGTLSSSYCQVCEGAPFDKHAMPDIDAWVRSQGERILLVYGANDPWTAGAFTLGNAIDSRRYTVEGGTHSASIRDLPAIERDEATATLERWGGKPKQPAPPTEELGAGDAGDPGGLGARLRGGARLEPQQRPVLTTLRRFRL